MNSEHEKIRKETLNRVDSTLSRYACRNSSAVRVLPETGDEIRLPFSIDRDRIIYSGAYRRSAGKTQVIYFASIKDEQISNRIIHVQYVSQISRTIGTALSLNLDLIEAASLGHDLGHPPFGHDGERFLSRECEKYGIGKFHHNIHSLYIVDEYSYRGRGLNLCLQTRDAIISHNGEIHQKEVKPDLNKSNSGIEEYKKEMKVKSFVETSPMTLEGCVIRMADTVSYIGADIEDAVRLELIKRSDLPKDAVKILGNNNGNIVDTLVKDIILNSYNKPALGFSEEISRALLTLKRFNYERIYNNPVLKNERKKIDRGFSILFETFMEDIETKNFDSGIYIYFLDNKSEDYKERTKSAEKVRDYIASMTDRYFRTRLENIIIPRC